jgi:hypothetical protein
MKKPITTFIIPTLGRDTLERAIKSVGDHPYLVMEDVDKEGAGIMRNRMIEQVETEWVSFLDDDDTVTEDYVDRLEEEILLHPEAHIIHFREYFIRNGHMLPSRNVVEWGNIGICYSIQTEVVKRVPFRAEPFEDFEQVKRAHEAGYHVYFSPFMVYRVRH